MKLSRLIQTNDIYTHVLKIKNLVILVIPVFGSQPIGLLKSKMYGSGL